MPKQPETLFKEKVLKDLKEIKNSWFFKVQSLSQSGLPDIIGLINGHFVAIELKTETGTLAKLQKHYLDKILKCGGVTAVATPSTWKGILRKITMLTNSPRR